MDLIRYVDSVNVRFGATTECFSTSTPEAQALRREALKYDLHLLQARVKHLGTENNLRILAEHLRGPAEGQDRPSSLHRRQAIRPAGRGLPSGAGERGQRECAATSSPPPAAPAPSGSPTSAAPWACP